ncbi:hypothetical protein KR018_000364, partial [Drosophila ironensis]
HQVAMEYLCILNAFEQNYYNRIKEIERLSAAAAASPSSASPASSSNSTSSTSCSSGPSNSSAASSTTNSPTAAREMVQAAAALAATQRLTVYKGHGQEQRAMLFHHQHQLHRQQLQHHHPLQAVSLSQHPQHLQPTADPNSSNSLLWQPWRDLQQAAAMHHQLYKQQQQEQELHQQTHKEMRVTAKELPTNKWRRERRQRASEYHGHDPGNSDKEKEREMDSPIDMSVSSGALKQQLRASPPPPYREPLPGTLYMANNRPSVITQAPPKREMPEQGHSSDVAVCDIDEHFRRSLGENYAALFAKNSPTPTPTPTTTPTPTPSPSGSAKQQVSPLAYGPLSVTSPGTAPVSHLYHQYSSSLSKTPLPVLSSPPALRATTASPQPELPPPQEEPLPLSLALNRTQTPSALSSVAVPAGTGPIGVQVVDGGPVSAKRILDSPHDTPPRYSSPPLPLPPPAYGGHNGGSVGPITSGTPVLTTSSTTSPTQTHNQIATPSGPATMSAIIRVKAKSGLSAAAASSTQTPPASPTASTNISIFTKTEASVDDHFAKALGETWKKLQSGQKE